MISFLFTIICALFVCSYVVIKAAHNNRCLVKIVVSLICIFLVTIYIIHREYSYLIYYSFALFFPLIFYRESKSMLLVAVFPILHRFLSIPQTAYSEADLSNLRYGYPITTLFLDF